MVSESFQAETLKNFASKWKITTDKNILDKVNHFHIHLKMDCLRNKDPNCMPIQHFSDIESIKIDQEIEKLLSQKNIKNV